MQYPATHGLITNWPGLLIGHGVADCGNLTLWDPETGFMCVVHVRRDLFPDIVNHAVIAMEEHGSKHTNILVAGGPMICADCYRFDAGFADKQLDPEIWVQKPVIAAEPYRKLDFRTSIEKRLEQLGIMPRNHHLTSTCTCCARGHLNNHAWPSARRNRTRRFLAASAILHPPNAN